MESERSFTARVRRLTGFEFDLLPKGVVADLKTPGSHEVCRRGSVYVIRVKEPGHVREGDGDGGQTFEPVDESNHFRVVTLED